MKKILFRMFIVSATVLIIFGLIHRYNQVNKFYLVYPTGSTGKIRSTLFDSNSVSYSDLYQSKIRNVKTESGTEFGPTFYPKIKHKQYTITFFEDVLVTVKPHDSRGLAIDSRNNVTLFNTAGYSESEQNEISKNTINYLASVESKIYQNWQRHPMLRFLKMIPLYEYFRSWKYPS